MAKDSTIAKATGVFPKMAMASVAIASFMDSFCLQIIVPNLPFAVQKWFPELDETEVGTYYGYIISCYSFGGIFGALFWGWYADAFGRKTSIMTCLSCQMVLALVFGLVPNYWLALCVRTLWGFTNGNLGVLKTYVSEVCSEDMQPLGFSTLVTMGGIANVVGPSLGGFLGDTETYFPAIVKAYPWIRDRPLFLPGLVGSLLSIIILILVTFTLEESLTREMIEANKEERKSSQKRYHELKDTMHRNPDYVPSIDDNYVLQMNEGGYIDLIKKRDILFSCLIYGCYAIIQAAQDAIYPVWLILSPENNGFSFTSSDLGWMYTGLSPNQIFSTPILFPMISRLMSPKNVSYLTGVIFALLLMIAPIAGLFTSASVPVQWVAILLTYGFTQCFRFMFVTNGMVFVTNSTYQDFRAKVNGLGQVSAALGRFIGPTMATTIFSWSVAKPRPFPFNYGCAFYFCGLVMMLVTLITCLLPDSINHRKPTLHEYIRAEHEKLEAQSIELVALKTMEKTNDELMDEKAEIITVQIEQTRGEKKEEKENTPTTPIVKPVQEIEMVSIETEKRPLEDSQSPKE